MKPRLRIASRLLCVLFLCGPVSTVYASDSTDTEGRHFSNPLLLRNDCPLYLSLSSTAPPDRARTMKDQRLGWEIGYLNSNYIIEQHNVTESDRIIVDTEIQRLELNLRYGLSDDLEVGTWIPYLIMGGGYMDDFIQSFEDTFGFVTPGARESRGKNGFQYLFRVNNQNVINKSNEAIAGLGDIPIQLKYRFRNQSRGWIPQASVRGVLKVPSASNPLLGNERFDGAVGVLAEQPIGNRLLILTDLDLTTAHLPLALKALDVDPVMVSGMVGAEFFLTQKASFQTQVAMTTNPYPKFHSDMTALRRVPMGIGIGGAYRLFKRSAFKLMIAENVFSAWSDFSWSASLQGEF